jgi:hypothetical protein
MVEAKLLRKKLKNGLIVDKWDLVTIIEKQQAEIEALKRPNNVVGVPCDELKKMQDRLAHLDKMIVWYQDITMTGIKSEEYENGFWDAVGFVKQHQIGVQEK